MNPHAQVEDLLSYIDAAPTPYHAIEETRRRLTAAGYREFDERQPWTVAPGVRFFVVRGGATIAAFYVGTEPLHASGFRLIGAHTDSPNLRCKPNADVSAQGYRQLGVEVYGGPLLYTWLDRDLSLAGRVFVSQQGASRCELVDFARPLLRVPSLAIHLDRTVNDSLQLNKQKHMVPVIGLEASGKVDLKTLLAEELTRTQRGTAPDEILGFDLCLYDVQRACIAGAQSEFICASRIDNLASCHAALSAQLAQDQPAPWTRSVVLYDHEECGSRSSRGAGSPFLQACLERIVAALGGNSADAFARAVAGSFLVSADMAHAVHPNYADKHESEHKPVLGGGPVIKSNVNQSYATEGESWAFFESVCRAADVTPQRFVMRTDLACGSTIGPISAAGLGIRTVDVGNPMLSMHSCRETAATADVPKMIAVLRAYFGVS